MKASVVIGTAYGDEGKGLFTDYLSSQSTSSMVVRFNGGAQAGHTVTTPEGLRHVFGHFGANSLLDNNHETYLSQFFIVNPILFRKEKQQLQLLGKYPNVTMHPNAYVTTPYDMILNQLVEKKRETSRHGSCGLGIGETIERSETVIFDLRVKDLSNLKLFKSKLINIRDEYVKQRAKKLEIIELIEKDEYAFLFSDDLVNRFIEDTIETFKDVRVEIKLNESENIVFEGAQGLLLDQDLGYFPYVTRSNTGLKNIIEIVKETSIDELDVVYATRCYTTRHGAGPLSNPLEEKPYKNIVDQTNIPNEFQGTLRFAYLDLDLLKQTIKRDQDKASVPGNLKLNYIIGVSCLDQTLEVCFYANGKLNNLKTEDFIKFVDNYFGYPMILSFGPTRDTILQK